MDRLLNNQFCHHHMGPESGDVRATSIKNVHPVILWLKYKTQLFSKFLVLELTYGWSI